MTKEQILKKSIEKAIKNGYHSDLLTMDVFSLSRNWYITKDNFVDNDADYLHISAIIFSHPFAKAFWGDKEVKVGFCCQLNKDLDTYEQTMRMKAWEFHLQKMVLEPEPLKYLEKFL